MQIEIDKLVRSKRRTIALIVERAGTGWSVRDRVGRRWLVSTLAFACHWRGQEQRHAGNRPHYPCLWHCHSGASAGAGSPCRHDGDSTGIWRGWSFTGRRIFDHPCRQEKSFGRLTCLFVFRTAHSIRFTQPADQLTVDLIYT